MKIPFVQTLGNVGGVDCRILAYVPSRQKILPEIGDTVDIVKDESGLGRPAWLEKHPPKNGLGGFLNAFQGSS